MEVINGDEEEFHKNGQDFMDYTKDLNRAKEIFSQDFNDPKEDSKKVNEDFTKEAGAVCNESSQTKLERPLLRTPWCSKIPKRYSARSRRTLKRSRRSSASRMCP